MGRPPLPVVPEARVSGPDLRLTLAPGPGLKRVSVPLKTPRIRAQVRIPALVSAPVPAHALATPTVLVVSVPVVPLPMLVVSVPVVPVAPAAVRVTTRALVPEAVPQQLAAPDPLRPAAPILVLVSVRTRATSV